MVGASTRLEAQGLGGLLSLRESRRGTSRFRGFEASRFALFFVVSDMKLGGKEERKEMKGMKGSKGRNRKHPNPHQQQ